MLWDFHYRGIFFNRWITRFSTFEGFGNVGGMVWWYLCFARFSSIARLGLRRFHHQTSGVCCSAVGGTGFAVGGIVVGDLISVVTGVLLGVTPNNGMFVTPINVFSAACESGIGGYDFPRVNGGNMVWFSRISISSSPSIPGVIHISLLRHPSLARGTPVPQSQSFALSTIFLLVVFFN